jgi:hypothetical protein
MLIRQILNNKFLTLFDPYSSDDHTKVQTKHESVRFPISQSLQKAINTVQKEQRGFSHAA